MKKLNFDKHFIDLFENSTDLIHLSDVNGSIIKANPAWLNTLGYSKEEVLGEDILSFIHPDYREEYKHHRDGVIKSNSTVLITFRFLGKNGAEIFSDGQLGCFFEDGRALYTRGVFKNFKNADKRGLENNESRLKDFLNSAPSAVIIANQEQEILEWNPKAEAVFGFAANEVMGESLSQIIIPHNYREAHAQGMKHFLLTGEGPVLNKTIEITALHRNGHIFPINLSISAVKEDEQWLFIAFISDISSQKLLQEEVIKKEAELLQSKLLDEKKDEFLSMASHELRTPLTSLKAYIQILSTSVSPEVKGYKFVSSAGTHILRLEKLINDLLDVSKIKAGKVAYTMFQFWFNDVLNDCVEVMQLTTKTHKIIIEKSTPVLLFGDSLRLEQVINNLLSNAVKYSPAASRILVKSEREGNNLLVSIKDFGIGIAAENREKLFERFYRVENNSSKYQGLGIGLYLSFDIIKRHNGSIWVESEPDQGTTFYFKLPVADNQNIAQTDTATSGKI